MDENATRGLSGICKTTLAAPVEEATFGKPNTHDKYCRGKRHGVFASDNLPSRWTNTLPTAKQTTLPRPPLIGSARPSTVVASSALMQDRPMSIGPLAASTAGLQLIPNDFV